MTAPQMPQSDSEKPSSDQDAKSKSRRRSSPKSRNHDGKKQFEGGLGAALSATVEFYMALAYFLCGRGFEACPYFKDSPQAKAQVYSLATTLWMWDRPHYRAGTFQEDMLANLRNVALPGTGIPLSLLVRHKILAFLFLLFGYPLVAIVAGLRKGRMVARWL